MVKKYTQMLGLILFAGILTGCANNSSLSQEENTDAVQVEGADEALVISKETYNNVEAIFVKQHNKESVEIKVNDQANTYSLEDLGIADLSNLSEGDKVIIDFVIKTKEVKNGEIKGTYLTRIEKNV